MPGLDSLHQEESTVCPLLSIKPGSRTRPQDSLLLKIVFPRKTHFFPFDEVFFSGLRSYNRST